MRGRGGKNLSERLGVFKEGGDQGTKKIHPLQKKSHQKLGDRKRFWGGRKMLRRKKRMGFAKEEGYTTKESEEHTQKRGVEAKSNEGRVAALPEKLEKKREKEPTKKNTTQKPKVNERRRGGKGDRWKGGE